MTIWIIKTETDDPDRAIEIVEDLRNRDINAWIEDEHGKEVDAQSLGINGRMAVKRPLLDWLGGPLFIGAFVVAGVFVLYLIGLWVDHD